VRGLAALQLRRVGLEVGLTARLPYSAVAEGTVLAQDPPAHAQGIARPSINLLVAASSEGDAPDGFVMPDLTGLPVVTAQAELASVGIKSATPKFVSVPIASVGNNASSKPPVRPGSVTAQQPSAGARILQSDTVKLTVAK